jgi:hypothetical protein
MTGRPVAAELIARIVQPIAAFFLSIEKKLAGINF